MHVPLQVKKIFNWDECCCVIYSDKHENKIGVVLSVQEKPCHQIHCFRLNYKSVRGNAEGSNIFELVMQCLTKSHSAGEWEGARLLARCVAGSQPADQERSPRVLLGLGEAAREAATAFAVRLGAFEHLPPRFGGQTASVSHF